MSKFRSRLPALFAASVIILSLGLLPGSAVAQQKTLKDAIVGTWIVTAVYDQRDDGRKIESFGADVKGTYIFGPDGSYTQILFGEPQPNMKTDEMRQADGFIVAYMGRYTVDSDKQTISYTVDRAANSKRDGFAGGFTVTLSGDTASLVGTARKDANGTFAP